MRIAIVNDMLFTVEALRRVVTSVPDYEIAWVARNGAEAVEKCAADTPDVILMDLILPVMDGTEATRRIMAASPCLILVVTATVGGNASKVFEAMGYGARDAVNTPVLGGDGRVDGGAALLAKIATLGKLLDKKPRQEPQRPNRAIARAPARDLPPLVAIGASTGGPAAVAHILSGLPARFPAALVIIQHVDVQFAAGLADWLQAQTSLTVRLAQEGCRLEVGTVWLAGTNDHMLLTLSIGRPRLLACCSPAWDGMARKGWPSCAMPGGIPLPRIKPAVWSTACPKPRRRLAPRCRFCPSSRLPPR